MEALHVVTVEILECQAESELYSEDLGAIDVFK